MLYKLQVKYLTLFPQNWEFLVLLTEMELYYFIYLEAEEVFLCVYCVKTVKKLSSFCLLDTAVCYSLCF